MGIDEFLAGVYEWLMKPLNRSVEEYHYDCFEFFGHDIGRKTVGTFLLQRYRQMYGHEPDRATLKEAISKYVDNMFS